MKPMTQKEMDEWNAGARIADATWHEAPTPSFEPAPDGRIINDERMGYYRSYHGPFVAKGKK